MYQYKNIILGSTLVLITSLALTVHSAHTTTKASVEAAAIDSVITAEIKALYAKSSLVRATDVQVTTINQNVVLSGEVKTKSQYERAITLADSVSGVQTINAENLSLKASKAPLIDSYTTAKVKSSFLKEKLFGSKAIEFWPVKVETKDSIVYLTGKVSSNKERINLIRLAQAVSGVRDVRSAITVR